MKLSIKKLYFDQIMAGSKPLEYRDAHITFICEETKRTLRRDIIGARIIPRCETPTFEEGLLMDNWVIEFRLRKPDAIEYVDNSTGNPELETDCIGKPYVDAYGNVIPKMKK